MRAGLGFDRCDVAVVTNITADHVGMKGIHTLDQMAHLKSVVPESVHPGGYAVFNAEDDRVYALRKNIQCRPVLFSMKDDNTRLSSEELFCKIVIREDLRGKAAGECSAILKRGNKSSCFNPP